FLSLGGPVTGQERKSTGPEQVPLHWEPAGWGGGGRYCAAVFHPTRNGVIYMSGDVAGVYKTEDHGKNWRQINNGLADYGVYSLAVDRTKPETVYAAKRDAQLFQYVLRDIVFLLIKLYPLRDQCFVATYTCPYEFCNQSGRPLILVT